MSKKIAPENFLKLVLDTIPIRVFWKDIDSKFLGGNQLLLEDLGLNQVDELIGSSDSDYLNDQQLIEHFRNDDLEVMRSKQPKLDFEEPLNVEGQGNKWLKTNKTPLISSEGEVIGVLGTYEDITEQVRYRKNIEKFAYLDSLTGLANRRKLQKRITENNTQVAGLIFIDLDDFKIINDSLGHHIGDLLLIEVANRLKQIPFLDNALVARLGGDEFSVFIPVDGQNGLQDELESAAKMVLSTLSRQFTVQNNILHIGASMGLTILDMGQNSVNSGFLEADLAMYSAKSAGKNSYMFYDSSMKDEAQRKHDIKSCLQSAIENDELNLVYQPQFNIDKDLIGAEALLRWDSKKLGAISPDEFIPLAEESGQIHKIGKWVLDSAISDWQDVLIKNTEFKIAVNFSTKQFEDKNLFTMVESALLAKKIPPNRLQIEITESLLMNKVDLAITSILKLQKLGIGIAIDDFGTGYSSLSYISTLPIDILKIDKSFVQNLQQGTTNYKLIDTIVSLSKNLNVDIIAEGVETANEKNLLISLECYQFQGFYFSAPINIKEFRKTYFAKFK